MSLTEKRFIIPSYYTMKGTDDDWVYCEKDIREAIRKIKREINANRNITARQKINIRKSFKEVFGNRLL